MRCTKWALGLALLLTASTVQADETPAQILDKAIAAHGGAEALAKLPCETWKAKGTVHIQGMAITFTGDWAIGGLNKHRASIEADFNGQQMQFSTILNGEQGWRKMADNVNEMSAEELKTERNNIHVMWATRLTPLKGKEYTLTPLKDIMVESKPAVGFLVARQGFNDVKMYFDKQSNLLVKVEFQTTDQNTGGEVAQENFYSGHKEVAGIKVPTKLNIKRDGTLFVESETTEVKRVEKVEEKLFQKPE